MVRFERGRASVNVERGELTDLLRASSPAVCFVTNIGDEEVLQISSLRIILETEALRLAKTHMTPAILDQLEQLMLQMDSCSSTHGNDGWARTMVSRGKSAAISSKYG